MAQKQFCSFINYRKVLSGDWRQCLPVVPKGSRAQIIHQTLKYSALWSCVKTFNLTENMRIKYGGDESAEFEKYLLRIGEGREPLHPEHGDNMVVVPEILESKAVSVEDFCNSIFPDINKRIQDGLHNIATHDRGNFEWIMSRAIICPTNNDAQEINRLMMKKLTGKLRVYMSADKTVDPDEAPRYPAEHLNTVSLPSLPLIFWNSDWVPQ